ncbi:hypothetical protein IST455A_05409 [Burkholderia multivorans]|nr:hypothetical protein IST455A_05409 [Burkholderia multivorans]CAB5304857.1 hypothetical protein IST455B_04857 [Burkholderia multivorans]CAB5311303.1 hypothetical protein IST419_04868 [Burkholderia multivorans]CAB5326945.1 hypothetical protein IST453_05513 [Burkholderia multivorans]CAB5341743.1 hypothetical protein IST424_05435 [Burkholderia multivorans]
MNVPRRQVRWKSIDSLDLLPPLKLRESIKLGLPQLGLLLHQRGKLFPLAKAAAPFGFIAHHKMRNRLGHPSRFQRVLQFLSRHLAVIVRIDCLFERRDEFTGVHLCRRPHKLRTLFVSEILLGRMQKPFIHIGGADATVVDQNEPRPFPRASKLHKGVSSLAYPPLPRRTVLRTNRDIPPVSALVVDRDVLSAELVKVGTTIDVPEVRSRTSRFRTVQREVLPPRNVPGTDGVRQTAFHPQRFANVRERLSALLMPLRGLRRHALGLHFHPPRSLCVACRHELQTGLGHPASQRVSMPTRSGHPH